MKKVMTLLLACTVFGWLMFGPSMTVGNAATEELPQDEPANAGQPLNTDTPFQPDLIFLLSGQSNMKGNGFTADLPVAIAERIRTPPANVTLWDEKQKRWKPLSPRVRFGPEISFAQALSAALPDQQIGIIKYAVGGTSMDRWQTDGELYAQLKTIFGEARATAPDAELAAMLWHQGESDSDSLELAEAYQEKLTLFIEAIRRDTENPNLLFILGQINPAASFQGRPRFLHADIVRRAQSELKMANVLMIPTDDCEKNVYLSGDAGTPPEKRDAQRGDGVHYSAVGQLKLGNRYAEAFLSSRGE